MDTSSALVYDTAMLNLNDLSLFVRVVDREGFTAAARALNIPKSTLSKRVAHLERTLGVRLIERTSRTFVVTSIGKEFYRHAAAMLIEADAAENVVKSRLAIPSGTVRITASIPTARFSLAGILPDLARTHEKIRLVLHATDRFVDIVQEGFDIAIRSHFSALPDSDLVQRRIDSQPLFVVASPGYLADRGTPKQPRDIAKHDGILADLSGAPPSWTLHGPNGGTQSVQPAPRFFADETLCVLNAAEAGLGITCLPRSFCQPSIKNGSLVRILPEWDAGSLMTTLLMPERRGHLPSVRAVVEYLSERLADRHRDDR